MVVCDIDCETGDDRCFYKQGDLKVRASNEIAEFKIDSNTVTLKANGYIHTVELEGDGTFSDNYFSMLPGETKTVAFESGADCTEVKLSAHEYTF